MPTPAAKHSSRSGMRNKNKAVFGIQLNSNPKVPAPASRMWDQGSCLLQLPQPRAQAGPGEADGFTAALDPKNTTGIRGKKGKKIL